MDLSLESMYGDAELEVECDVCKKEFSIQLNQILEDRSIIQCPYCKTDIEIIYDETTKKAIHDVDNATEEFNKSFAKFEKTMKKFR